MKERYDACRRKNRRFAAMAVLAVAFGIFISCDLVSFGSGVNSSYQAAVSYRKENAGGLYAGQWTETEHDVKVFLPVYWTKQAVTAETISYGIDFRYDDFGQGISVAMYSGEQDYPPTPEGIAGYVSGLGYSNVQYADCNGMTMVQFESGSTGEISVAWADSRGIIAQITVQSYNSNLRFSYARELFSLIVPMENSPFFNEPADAGNGGGALPSGGGSAEELYYRFLEESDGGVFAILDIDGDGTSDLLYGESEDTVSLVREKTQAYTVRDGAMTDAGVMLNLSCMPLRKNRECRGIIASSALPDAKTDTIYTIENGAVKALHTLTFNRVSPGSYYYNGFEISAQEYQKYYSDYFAPSKMDDAGYFRENTQEERNLILSLH